MLLVLWAPSGRPKAPGSTSGVVLWPSYPTTVWRHLPVFVHVDGLPDSPCMRDYVCALLPLPSALPWRVVDRIRWRLYVPRCSKQHSNSSRGSGGALRLRPAAVDVCGRVLADLFARAGAAAAVRRRRGTGRRRRRRGGRSGLWCPAASSARPGAGRARAARLLPAQRGGRAGGGPGWICACGRHAGAVVGRRRQCIAAGQPKRRFQPCDVGREPRADGPVGQ